MSDHRPLNVVVVNEGLGYPATAGNWIRTLNLMLRLAKRHRITYICRAVDDRAAVKRAADFYADQGIRAIIVDDPVGRKSGARFYGSLAANLLSNLPYAIASHNSTAVRRAIAAYAAENPVDLWQFECLGYTDALRHLPDARTLVMAHNIESQIWRRIHLNESAPLKRWYFHQQWRKFELFERRVFSAATRVVAVSEQDAVAARERYGARRIDIVDNGVDRALYGEINGQRRLGQILYLGTLDWLPNLDAVEQLLRIFPCVRERELTAHLCIVGRNPPQSLIRRLGTMPNASLHADVPDVRPYLAQSAVMAVPLRIGGGSRLKIIEAMAAGLPVVSTMIGCEGLRLVPGRDITVVENVDQMADALVHAVKNPATMRAAADRARRLVLERYDWDVLADRLERIWRQTIAEPAAAPAADSSPSAEASPAQP